MANINTESVARLGLDVWDGAPSAESNPAVTDATKQVREIIHDPTGQHIYNVPAVDWLYNKLAKRIANVENIGEYLGSFADYTQALPTNVSYFTAIDRTANKNDFVTVINNDRPGATAGAGQQVRYVITNVNPTTGAIEWTQDIIYGTDVTDKQDKANNNGNTNIAVFSGTGLQSSYPSLVKLEDIVTKDTSQLVSIKSEDPIPRELNHARIHTFLAGRVQKGTIVWHTGNHKWEIAVAGTPGLLPAEQTRGVWDINSAYNSGDIVLLAATGALYFAEAQRGIASGTPMSAPYDDDPDWVRIGMVDVPNISDVVPEYLAGNVAVVRAVITTIAVGEEDAGFKKAISIAVRDKLDPSYIGQIKTVNIEAIPGLEPVGLEPAIGTVLMDVETRVVGTVTSLSTTSDKWIVSVYFAAKLGDTWTSIPLVVA